MKYKEPRFALFVAEGTDKLMDLYFLVGKAYPHFFYMVVCMIIENISKQSRDM